MRDRAAFAKKLHDQDDIYQAHLLEKERHEHLTRARDAIRDAIAIRDPLDPRGPQWSPEFLAAADLLIENEQEGIRRALIEITNARTRAMNRRR